MKNCSLSCCLSYVYTILFSKVQKNITKSMKKYSFLIFYFKIISNFAT